MIAADAPVVRIQPGVWGLDEEIPADDEFLYIVKITWPDGRVEERFEHTPWDAVDMASALLRRD